MVAKIVYCIVINRRRKSQSSTFTLSMETLYVLNCEYGLCMYSADTYFLQ